MNSDDELVVGGINQSKTNPYAMMGVVKERKDNDSAAHSYRFYIFEQARSGWLNRIKTAWQALRNKPVARSMYVDTERLQIEKITDFLREA